MAYKPKYAAKGRTSGSAPEKTRPASPVKAPEKKKRSILTLVLLVLLTLIVVPVSSYATGKLLLYVGGNVGRPKAPQQSRVESVQLADAFDTYVQGKLKEVRLSLGPVSDAAVSGEQPSPEASQPAETKPEIVREHYTIAPDAKVAPEPNQNYFGETTDPASLGWLLEEAAWMLQDDPMYFSLDTQIYANSKIQYYLDDSIFAITWKEVHEDSVYTFAEVKLRDPSQFRRHLAGGEFGSDMQYFTTEMAQTVNAVVASAGDFHRFRDFGICVYEGTVKKVEGTYAETCMVDRNGNLKFVYGGEITKTADAQAYVDANDIQFSLCFGPVLVDDYQVKEHSWYGVGEINEGYARAALCQMADLHYLVATANVQDAHQELHTVETFQKYIVATGCRMAYCLDGGQTATIVMNDKVINHVSYGAERYISDIIYFATAMPETE